MAATAEVRARIDPRIKKEAADVLASMGLTLSDAIRMMITNIAHERDLPLDAFRPSPKTLAAMREAENGIGKRTTLETLISDLNSDDDADA